MLRSLVRERGLAVLLSSHLLSQVQSVCDRVGIFAAGQLIGVGTVEELAAASARIGRASRSVSRTPGPADDRATSTKCLGASIDGVEGPSRRAPSRSCWSSARRAASRVRREATSRCSRVMALGLSSIRETVPSSLDDIYRHAVRQAGLDTAAQRPPAPAPEGRRMTADAAAPSAPAAPATPAAPPARPAPGLALIAARSSPTTI